MELTIRKENPEDFKTVFNLIEKAFENEQMSDHKEQFLVERLRKSNAFVPELLMVVETENQIVGHILLTKLQIKNEKNEFESLALAPVSVLPEYQRNGIGGTLIKEAHKKAKELGFRSVILLGHEKYYLNSDTNKPSDLESNCHLKYRKRIVWQSNLSKTD